VVAGCSGQVVVVQRQFSTKIAWEGFRVVVVDSNSEVVVIRRWSLFGGGRYSEVVVSSGLTVCHKFTKIA